MAASSTGASTSAETNDGRYNPDGHRPRVHRAHQVASNAVTEAGRAGALRARGDQAGDRVRERADHRPAAYRSSPIAMIGCGHSGPTSARTDLEDGQVSP
jgi:hypothetical protein